MSDAARQIVLLSKIGALAGTLEYGAVLAAVARLSIPEFADWCVVDVLEDGELHRVEVAYRDPTRAALAERLRQVPPPRLDQARADLLSGRPLYVPDYTDDWATAHAWFSEHVAITREIGVRSLLVVPLVVGETFVGVSAFATTSESGRRFGEEDLALSEELARRAAAIVENARLHRELKRSEQRFRLALAHSPVSVFETDRDLHYTWVYNPMFGLEQEDLIGKVPSGFSPPGDVRYSTLKKAVLETGEPNRGEIELVVEGVTRHCLVHMEPLRDPSGEIVGIAGAATDVTEQKRAQEELAEAFMFRERLLSVLAHDLRNPASAVLMIASALLKRGDNPGRSRAGVIEIKKAAERMLEMIATLLDFGESRFRGRLPIQPIPTDLHEVTRVVTEEVLAANPGRRVHLAMAGDGRGRWDPARMAQVVSNLVGNAIAYGAPGEPVRVSLEGDADRLRLSVWNAGTPIAPELRAVLFQPFRRGAASRNRGLGLGLYIVKQIVTAHGGDVDVKSTAEDGTTFAVRVPRGVMVAHDERSAREYGASA